MPTRPPRPCSVSGCSALTHERYCQRHKQERERQRSRYRGTTTQRGYGTEWQRIRKAVIEVQPWCACGAKAVDVDHIIPLTKGGTSHPANLNPICRTCHNRKTSKRR